MPDIATIRLRDDITLDELQGMLSTLVELQGCPACGLNGFDIHFKVDPSIRFAALTEKFRDRVIGIDVAPGLVRERAFG